MPRLRFALTTEASQCQVALRSPTTREPLYPLCRRANRTFHERTKCRHASRRRLAAGNAEFRRERAMLSRRDLIGKAAVGAAAALAVGTVVGTGIAATRPLRDATDDPVDP